MSFFSAERNPDSLAQTLDALLHQFDKTLIKTGQTSSAWNFRDNEELVEYKFTRKRISNKFKINPEVGSKNCFKLKDKYNSQIETDPYCLEINANMESIYETYSCAFKVDKGYSSLKSFFPTQKKKTIFVLFPKKLYWKNAC